MFKPNDLVLCIDARQKESRGIMKLELEEGRTYKVHDVSTCKCEKHNVRLSLEGKENTLKKGPCLFCGAECFGAYSWRFIKLKGDDTEKIIAKEKQDEIDRILEEIK